MHRLELFFLYAFILFLPNYETPKVVALFFFAVFWFINRIKAGVLRCRRPEAIEWIMLAMLMSVSVSMVLNWPRGDASIGYATRGLRDTLYWLLTFWLLYRSGYTEREMKWVFFYIVLGALLGLVQGGWDLIQRRHDTLQFHSAGIVTQSSIYLGIVILLVLGRSLFSNLPILDRSRLYWFSCLALFIVCLFLMGSRGSIFAVLLAIMALLVFSGRKWPRILLIMFVAICIAAGSYFVSTKIFDYHKPSQKIAEISMLFSPNKDRPRMSENDRLRFEIWRVAMAQIKQGSSPLFGIGPRNFDTLDVEQLHFDPPLQYKQPRYPHAHNLFLTKWVEEGLVGLVIFFVFLAYFAGRLMRYRGSGVLTKCFWVGGIGALIVPVGAGFFNSPWRHEYAILAMLVLSVYCVLSEREEHHRQAGAKT